MGHVLRSQHQHRVALGVEVVAAERRHGRGEGLDDPDRVGAYVLGHRVGRLGVDHGDRAFIGGEAPLDVQRLPRVGVFMLADAEGVLAGVAVLAEIDFRRDGAAEVDQDQPHGPADGGVGPPARSEDAVAVVDPEPLDDGAVDDDQRRAGMGRRLAMRQPVGRLRHRLDRGDQHRKIFGLTAGHHRVDGDLPQRRLAHGGRNDGDEGVGVAPRHAGEQPIDALRRRRHDGQSIGPALFIEVVIDRIE